MNKYILGLDVSTATVGISLFEENGKLLELNHISPIVKDDQFSREDILWEKASLIVEFLSQNYKAENVIEIIIEAPLISSKQFDTAALLNFFGGMVYGMLRTHYKCKINYITVDEARRYGLPELVGGKKNTLFGVFNEILDRKFVNEYKKMIVLSLVAQRYPSIIWLFNNNLMVDKKNFDRADSIVAVLGYKQKNKIWEVNEQDIVQTVEFIKRNVLYEKYCKTLSGTKTEKNQKKYQYLKQTFEIENFLNVAL